MRFSRPTLPILLLSVLAACGGGDAAEAARAVVRDSAGVQIVENTGDGWRVGKGWTVADTPSVRIGVAEGEPEYQFDGVGSAVRLSDGRIVVANSGTGQLRAYDARGRYLGAAGGKGGGPGEFQLLADLRLLPGDSLLVNDAMLSRLSWFGPDLRFARALAMENVPGGFARFAGRMEDGSLLMSRSLRKWGDSESGTVRDTLAWVRVDPAATRIDTVARSLGEERKMEMKRQPDGGMRVSMSNFPFNSSVATAVGPGGWWQGQTERYELTLRRPDGTPVRIVRRAHAPVPVRGAYLDSLKRVNARREPSPLRAANAPDPLEKADLPESLPAFSRLLVDDEGNLWVETFPWPGRDLRTRWEVFDPEGKLLGTVELPAGLRATHVGRDFVLGVWRDEEDVQYVRMHPLRKP